MSNKKAFVTGANGFVGSYLVKYLADHDIETIAFILRGTDCHLLKLLHPSLKHVKIIEGDVLDKKSFEDYIKGMNYVFHLAGVVQGYTQEDYDRINVKGTQNILEVCSSGNPKLERLVIISSSAAAGTGTIEDPLKEDKEAQPIQRDYYGISKHKMESLTKSYGDVLPISIVRPCSVLGPGNRVNLNMYKSVKYKFRMKLGGLYRPLSMIDVRDLVKGIYLCAVNPKAIGETFYFANNETVSFNELHDIVSETVFNRKKGKLISILLPNFMFRLFGWLTEVIYKIRRKPAPFVNRSKVLAFLAAGQVVSSTKAKKLLGWQATKELASTIAEEGQWNIDQGLVEMTEQSNSDTLREDSKEIPIKEILLLSIPVSIIFAISGMDFIGYFVYLATRTSEAEIYSRSWINVILGFTFTAISLLIIPLIVNKVRWKKPLSYFGNQIGKKKIGLIVVLIFVFVTPLFYLISRDQNIIYTYPLTKDVLISWPVFALYELGYILLYYVAYEFFFRGVLQLGLSKTWKSWQSILLVTLLTTLLHLTKPWTEILASLFAGVAFGFLAEKTKSWYYVFILHAISGVLIDIFSAIRFLGVI